MESGDLHVQQNLRPDLLLPELVEVLEEPEPNRRVRGRRRRAVLERLHRLNGPVGHFKLVPPVSQGPMLGHMRGVRMIWVKTKRGTYGRSGAKTVMSEARVPRVRIGGGRIFEVVENVEEPVCAKKAAQLNAITLVYPAYGRKIRLTRRHDGHNSGQIGESHGLISSEAIRADKLTLQGRDGMDEGLRGMQR